MKRSGFTMIELIFVIVILGILAAVAVPRLAGVQDDALSATEKSTIGAIRGGVQALSGKIMIRSGDDTISVKAYSEDGTQYNISYDLTSNTDTDGVINQKPIGLSADGAVAEDANLTATQTSSDADKTLAAVLDPGSDRGKWNTKADTTAPTTNTKLQGPASSVLEDTSEAEYNKGGYWLYAPAAGSITWQTGTY